MLAEPSHSDLQSVAAQMQSRLLDNLAAFKQHVPALFELLVALPPDGAPIDLNEQGMRLMFNGQDVYPGDPWVISQQQVDQFVLRPNAYSLYPVAPEDDGIAQHRAMTRLIPAEDLAPRQIASYEFDRVNAPIILCFGVGCGFHIEQLLARLNLRHLVLFEASAALLRASLYCIDWRDIFSIFSAPGRHLDIILGDNVDTSATTALQSIRRYSPMFSTAFLMIDHLSGDYYDALKIHLKSILSVSIQGLGFYDDELQGLEQTSRNLQRNPPVLHHPPVMPKDSAAFVVGSGPSLDNAIEILKLQQKSAVIFSCGSALGPLLANGITPDFHLEQERHEHTRIMLDALGHQDELKKIHLIMLNVVPPEISEKFKSSSLALKGHDAAAHLFPPGTPQLNFSNPTVTNFGVSLCTFLEFGEIYLFGVDLAVKNVTAHHASATAYEKRDIDDWESALESTLTRSLAGNFGGMVRSTDLFNWAKIHFEHVASKQEKHRQFFNCSDGAKIEGFSPQLPDEVSLSALSTDKQATLRKIRGCFSRKTHSPEYFAKALTVITNDFERLTNVLHAHFIEPLTSRSEFIERVDQAYLVIHDHNTQQSTQVIMGAIFKHFLLLTHAYSSCMKDQDAALGYINDSVPVFCEFIGWASQDLSRFVDSTQASEPHDFPHTANADVLH